MVRSGFAVAMIALVLAAGALVAAGDDALSLPGYVDFDMKTISGGMKPQVEVNLPKALLRVAAAAMVQEQPDLMEVLDALELIRVQVYEAPSGEAAPEGGVTEPVVPAAPVNPGSDTLDVALARLQEDSGWMQTIKVQEDGETESVQVFMKAGENGNVQGLAVFVNDLPESLVFVNIAGDIQPELLGKAVAFATQGKMDISQLGALLEQSMGGAVSGVPGAPTAPVAPSAPAPVPPGVAEAPVEVAPVEVAPGETP
jgi:hypothetical protein